MTQPDSYAVLGSPIGHSLSPYIHQQFAASTEQNICYQAIEVKADEFDQAIDSFFSAGGKGVNCTVPLKELAYQRADILTERARLSGAVNTLLLNEQGALVGDNTDGLGLSKDLTEVLGVSIAAKQVLILGAGGATRGILAPLLELNPKRLCIVNRTLSKATALALQFEGLGSVEALTYEELVGQKFEVIINATSASLTGELPAIPNDILAEEAVCYDLAYAKEDTAFVTWGKAHGATHSVDGLGMLVEQAAHAFNLWRGVMPETKGLREELRFKD